MVGGSSGEGAGWHWAMVFLDRHTYIRRAEKIHLLKQVAGAYGSIAPAPADPNGRRQRVLTAAKR